MADPKVTAADLANWKEIARQRAEARTAKLVEFGTFLEGMLSEVLDKLELSGVDDLHAAFTAIVEVDPSRWVVRRLGMERVEEWRARFESLLADPDPQMLEMFNRAWDSLPPEEQEAVREEREDWLGSHPSASDVRLSGDDDWDAALEAAREDVRRSGTAEMSEEELIAAAEAAKGEYRRERRMSDPTLRLLIEVCHLVDSRLGSEVLKREPELLERLVEAERHACERTGCASFGDLAREMVRDP